MGMAKTDPSLDSKLQAIQNSQGKLDPPIDTPNLYSPNKRRRAIRRETYQRYYWLRNDPLRVAAEADWDIADKEYSMYVEQKDEDDWHADVHLPDAFAAIQTQAQETIERKSRPTLVSTEESDEPLSEFCNDVINYNMNNTGYDYQYYLAKLAAAIRGTAFIMDYWRIDKRIVKDPDSLNDDGTIKYIDREITDFDDDYTEWVPNEYIYVDEKAKDIDEALDMFRREIINIDEFHRKYGSRPDFFDTEYVYAGGDRSTRSFFQVPHDITDQDVEVLHYYNRAIDAYWVVANNVTIHDSPLPWKHKELPLGVLHQYHIPGQFWGVGIPKVIHYLSEERKTIRNLNLDRQKLQINKMFLHNSSFDIDDDDTVSRPGGIISVDTNGQPINNAITPLEYGDVPNSYFQTEEILLEDMRRAHGIDDRVSGANVGSTATQAAIQKESAIKRINLISIQAEMSTVVRIGRLKWANIQFFYGVPRMEKISEDNEEREQKVYKQITVSNRKYSIVKDNGGTSLRMDEVKGATGLNLNKQMAKYLESSVDVTVDASVFTPISKAIEQTKKTEVFSLINSVPEASATLDMPGAVADLLRVNDIKPDLWMKSAAKPAKDQMMLAEAENMIMAAGQPLSPTEGASSDHTMVHLMFTKGAEFQQFSPEIQALFEAHILGEHDANPDTGSAAEALAAGAPTGGTAGPSPAGGAGQAQPLALSPQTTQPESQVADLQPTNFAAPER
jgi:hypothetical protein